MTVSGATMVARTFEVHKTAHNERAQRQDEIERRLVGQLGERYRDARLVEVSEGSYLIQNRIRLPIFGKNIAPIKRNKDNILKKTYLLEKQSDSKKYVLEKHTRSAGQGESQMLPTDIKQSTDGQPGMNPATTQPIIGTRPGVDTFDSESEQQQIGGSGIQMPIPKISHSGEALANSGQLNTQINEQLHNLNIASKVQSGTSGPLGQVKVDESIVNYVYNKYIDLLQFDKNASIEQILKQEPIASQISAQLVVGPQGTIIQGYSERDIEQAVIDKLYQEEETQDIQNMIAKFYNKFDELHEQSVAQALAKEPNREQLKKEVKYRIPERWTGKFHKYDVVDINIYNQKTGIVQERGKINKQELIEQKEQIEKNVKMNIIKGATLSGDQSLLQSA